MKLTVKLVALLLAVVAVLSSLIVWLSCSLMNDNSIKKGDWLVLLCDKFGMDTYMEDEPYTNTVEEDSDYFPYVQIAYEWGIINDKEIDPDDKVTKGYVAETLVKCVGLEDVSGMSEEEITEFAVENKYVDYEYKNSSDRGKKVTPEEAEDCLEAAFIKWTDREYEVVEEYDYVENVVDLSESTVLEEAIEQNQVAVDEVNQTVTLPAEAVTELAKGEVFVLPAVEEGDTVTAYKAEDIVIEDGVAYIRTSAPALEDVVENMDVSGSFEPDLDEIEFVDGAGNVIPVDGTEQTSAAAGGVSYLGGLGAGYNTTAAASRSFSFEVNGLSISGKIKKNSVSVTLKGETELGKKSGAKASVEKSYELKDVGIDYDWKIEWFKLKSAYVKLNYTTVDTTKGELSWDKTGSLFADQRGNYATNENGVKYWKDWYNKSLKLKADEAGKKTITICSFTLVNGWAARVDLDVKLKVSVSGSIELVVETRNTNGLEYTGSGLRYIKEQKRDIDLNVKGKAEFTVYLGLTLKALGCNLIGAGAEAGIGIEATVTAHMLDSSNKLVAEVSSGGNAEMIDDVLTSEKGLALTVDGESTGELHFDVCLDIKTYGILKIGIDSDCEIYSLLKKLNVKVSLEKEILGSDNAQIKAWCKHMENWQWVGECTRTYDKWEAQKVKDDEEAAVTDGGSSAGDSDSSGDNNVIDSGNDEFLDIDTYYLNLLVGGTDKISVTQLPSGYKKDAVQFTSGDPSVVTVDSSGKITAVGEGIAVIEVTIPGTDYMVTCSVVVSAVNSDKFTGIQSSGV